MARPFFMQKRVLSMVLCMHISMVLCNILVVYPLCVSRKDEKTVEQGIFVLF